MFQNTIARRAGFLQVLRNLVSWNKNNAAARLAEVPSSDTPPAKLSEAELARIKRAVASGNATLSSTRSSSGNSSRGSSSLDYRNLSVESPEYNPEVLLPHMEQVVMARRSTKAFDPSRPVDKALVQRLLADAVRAPTGNNLQPWHAIVVHDESQKEALCRAALGQRQVITAPYTIVFAGDTEAERYAPQVLEQGLENGAYGPQYGPYFLRSVYYHLHGGPMQSMALAKNVLSSWYSQQTNTPLLSVPVSKYGYAWKQTMIPATTFLYLATAAGLDSCVMEGIDEEAVKAVVGLPERFTVPVLISVGHAAPGDGYGGARRPKTPRFAVNHLIRWGRY